MDTSFWIFLVVIVLDLPLSYLGGFLYGRDNSDGYLGVHGLGYLIIVFTVVSGSVFTFWGSMVFTQYLLGKDTQWILLGIPAAILYALVLFITSGIGDVKGAESS